MKNNFLVDTHCHLDLIEKKGFNIDEIIINAKNNNVKILQTISTKISEFEKVYAYAKKYDNVFASLGNHPCNVNDEPEITADEIIRICQSHSKIIGLGETGLDYFHPGFVKEKQIASFIEHIKAARELDIPVIIHSRDADEDMIKILEDEMKNGKFKALLHCFSSSKELAQRAIELGVFISISGIITFKNATTLQEIIKDVPLEFLLVETDSPYLAPMPFRGKPNEPAYTMHTAEFLANLKGISLEELSITTTNNFFRLFNKAHA